MLLSLSRVVGRYGVLLGSELKKVLITSRLPETIIHGMKEELLWALGEILPPGFSLVCLVIQEDTWQLTTRNSDNSTLLCSPGSQ